jgi:hypothetical protein
LDEVTSGNAAKASAPRKAIASFIPRACPRA